MMNYLMVHQTFTGVRQDFYVYLTRTGTSFSLVPHEIDRPGLILRFGSVLMEAKAGQFIASHQRRPRKLHLDCGGSERDPE